MTCKEVSSYSSDYLDGEISESLKKDIENHLNGCLQCKAAANKENSVKNYLKELSRIKASDNFEIQLKNRITLELSKNDSQIKNWVESVNFIRNKTAFGFAVAAIIIAASIVLINSQKSDVNKFEVGDGDFQKETINQYKAGMVSDKNRVLKNSEALSVGSSGSNDSTMKLYDSEGKQKALEDKVQYINK